MAGQRCYLARMAEPDPKPYHHGDLRSALLTAAEAELAERGVEGFSLRSVAKRAGVSHAAPAHHFGDAGGVLTALAADGFRRFLGYQNRREAVAARDPRSQVTAAGLGYVDFALERPTLFRLIFGSSRLNRDDAEFVAAATAAYQHLHDQAKAMGGAAEDADAFWAMAHGLADLVMSGRLKSLSQRPAGERDAAVAAMLGRVIG